MDGRRVSKAARFRAGSAFGAADQGFRLSSWQSTVYPVQTFGWQFSSRLAICTVHATKSSPQRVGGGRRCVIRRYIRGLTLSGIFGPLLAAAIAILCAIAGIRIAGHRARLLVPASGAILVAVTVFGLVPELVQVAGLVTPLVLMGLAYLVLTVLDRKGYPVCPSCSHGEAFAETFILATGIHAFVDGWGMSAVEAGHIAPMAIGGAILFHKIPEGLALGGLLRGAPLRPSRAIAFAILAEAPTVAGGFAGLHAAPGVWVTYALAVASGSFLFFGVHAVEGWWIRTNLQSGRTVK